MCVYSKQTDRPLSSQGLFAESQGAMHIVMLPGEKHLNQTA